MQKQGSKSPVNQGTKKFRLETPKRNAYNNTVKLLSNPNQKLKLKQYTCYSFCITPALFIVKQDMLASHVLCLFFSIIWKVQNLSRTLTLGLG